MKKINYNTCYSGAVYFVGVTTEDGNVVPLTDPRSQEADEGIIDLSGSSQRIKANRPAVVISSDDCAGDSVLMAFLTRRAVNRDGTSNGWYKSFSPSQVDIEFTGSPATVLCSHIARVQTDLLAEWMGEVTEAELASIVNEVRSSGRFDGILHQLYQPAGSQPER